MSDIDTSREAVERLQERLRRNNAASIRAAGALRTIEEIAQDADALLTALLTRAETAERERDEQIEKASVLYVDACGMKLGLIEALRERDALRAQMAWQPIETAPRDRTEILIFDPDNAVESRLQIVLWNDIWNEPGWQSCMDNEEVRNPTHWRPLPTPPETP